MERRLQKAEGATRKGFEIPAEKAAREQAEREAKLKAEVDAKAAIEPAQAATKGKRESILGNLKGRVGTSPPAREYKDPHDPHNSKFAKSHAPVPIVPGADEKAAPAAGDGFRHTSPKKAVGGGMGFKSRTTRR